MAIVLSGTRAAAALITSGQGKLLGLVASHAQATVQTVTFYDSLTASGTVLLVLHIAPERNPIYLQFPKTNPFAFSTGLSASYANCDLAIWAVTYG